MDALTKQLVVTLSPANVLLFRSIFILLIFLPLAAFGIGLILASGVIAVSGSGAGRAN